MRYGRKRGFCGAFGAASIVLFCVLSGEASGLERVRLDEAFAVRQLGNLAEYRRDDGGSLTIGEILGESGSRGFRRSGTGYPSFGHTGAAYWGRFAVVNTMAEDYRWYLEFTYPQLDAIDLYIVDREGRLVDTRSGGDRYSFGKREVPFKSFTFRFLQPPGAEYTVYYRVRTTSSMNLQVRVWRPERFADHRNLVQLGIGFYCGAIIIMQIYTLFLLVSMRDPNYLWYILYYLAYLLFQFSLDGVAFQYLWPNAIWWNNHSIAFLISLSSLLALVFARSYLSTSRNLPVADRVIRGVLVAEALFLPVTLAIPYQDSIRAAYVVVLGTVMIIFYCAVRLLLRGYRPAWFYLLAWSVFLIGTILHVLRYLSVLSENVITTWGQQVASLTEIVLISFGLADKINRMQGELQKLSVDLEQVVYERTSQLHQTMGIMRAKEQALELELDLASHIQKGIFPQPAFMHDGIRVVSYNRAMGKVGGDFYDIFKMMGGNLGILMADVSGHGIPAAFITALAKISFSEAIQRYLLPRDIFIHVNDQLTRSIKTDDFVTAFFVVISPTYEVSYCNASHNKALVLRREGLRVEEWDTNGLFMGALPEASDMYQDGFDRLAFGDRLILYTDGVTEAQNLDGEGFGEARLRQLMVQTAGLDLAGARDAIVTDWRYFLAGRPQQDDMALLMVEIDPAYEQLIGFRSRGKEFLAEERLFEAIDALHQALALNAEDEKTNLLLGECYMRTGSFENAIRHYESYLRCNEVDPDSWYQLARACYYVGEFAGSVHAADRAVKLRKHFIDALIIQGLSYKGLNDRAAAAEVWRRILALDPENGLAHDELREATTDA